MARTTQQYGTTWWGRKWLDALSGIDFANRIPRGKSYANTGRVYSLDLNLKKGLITAKVSGNYDPFYTVKIGLPRVAAAKAQRFLDELAASPVILAGLAVRRLDPQVLQAAEKCGIQVFPQRWSDLKLSCSCPDWAVPCKHLAAVIYKMSQEIDANPFVLFELLGIDIFAGLEQRGISITRTQEREMPSWQELLQRGEVQPALPLSCLRDISYAALPDLKASILGLLPEAPAGYTLGSLKNDMAQVLGRAARVADKLLKDKQERDLPRLRQGPLFKVSAEGALTPGDFSWLVYLPDQNKTERYHVGGRGAGTQAHLCFMFSGAVDPRALEKAPEGIEALYQIWLTALKLILSGSVMPQIFAPAEGVFAIRWIPAVLSAQVQQLTQQTGQALLSLPEGCLDIAGAPEPMPALALGEMILSAYISSFIHCATGQLRSVSFGDPDRDALFAGRVIDPEDYVNGSSIPLRLEAWLSPLYLDHTGLKPVIVLSDCTVGSLDDLVAEKRGAAGSAAEEPQAEELRQIMRQIMGLDLPPANTAVAEETAEKEKAKKDAEKEEEKTAAAAQRQDAEIAAYAGRSSWLDGRAAIPDEEVLPASADTLIADDMVRAGIFDNQSGIKIAMGFRGGADDAEILPLPEVLSRSSPDVRFECLRTLSRLAQICPQLRELLAKPDGCGMIDLSDLAAVVQAVIPALRLLGVELIIPRALKKILTPKAALTIDIAGNYQGEGMLSLEQLLKFDWHLSLGPHLISAAEFALLSAKAGQIVRFREQFVYVDEQEVARIAKRLQSSFAAVTPRKLLCAALTGKFGQDNVLLSRQLQEALNRLISEQPLTVPPTLQATLRPYQERGYAWLMRNIKTTMGSILADDMGLGKTLQVITALERMRLDGMLTDRGALVAVPTSLLVNWQRELQKFAPELSCKVFYGSKRRLEPFTHVTLTTYGVLRTQVKLFKAMDWAVFIIDEAQAVKNHSSQLFRAVRQIKAGAFVAMSGTPVENRLMEYWSIMDFANPGLLGGAETFKKEFAGPIERSHDAEAIARFHRLTAPFILRRLKTDKKVIADLPDKLSFDRFCALKPEQSALYNEVVQQTMQEVKEGEPPRERRLALVLNLIARLKQICNSPEQFAEDSPYRGPQYSGKAEMLFSILDEIFASGRRCLIFTQFRRTGLLLQQWLAARYGFSPDFLHGETSLKERQRMVDSFQSDRSRRAMILSLKAAGTGLNLTAASAVVHFDLWWNPAVEEQATDRAYRIGQQNKVEVYRLITAGTFEEKVNEILQAKKELAELTVGSGESWIGNLSQKELEEIFALSEAAPQPAAADADADA